MTATMNSTSYQSGYCMTSAAACTSAHISRIVDTVALAVSIIIVRLVSLLVLKV